MFREGLPSVLIIALLSVLVVATLLPGTQYAGANPH